MFAAAMLTGMLASRGFHCILQAKNIFKAEVHGDGLP